MSLFFVDSNCDLNKEYIKKLGVECISLPYSINDKKIEFDDEFDYKKFYSKYKKGVVVSNCNLSTEDYMNIFGNCLELGDDIIYVHSSANLVDITNLQKAKDNLMELFPERKIAFIDSGSISIGQGLVSNELALMYRRGENVEDILENSYTKKNETAMYFASGDCEQMRSRGFVDGSIVPGTMLNIKPIFTMDIDGKIQLIDKVSGKKKAILKLLEICRQYGENVVDYPISIVYGNDEVSANELVLKLKETFGEDVQLNICQMSPSVASLLGDKTLGIAFHVRKKLN